MVERQHVGSSLEPTPLLRHGVSPSRTQVAGSPVKGHLWRMVVTAVELYCSCRSFAIVAGGENHPGEAFPHKSRAQKARDKNRWRLERAMLPKHVKGNTFSVNMDRIGGCGETRS